MISANHQSRLLSVEHKPDLPEEKARIEAAGGRVKNHRINGLLGMSRSLGDFQFKGKRNLPKEKQMVISEPDIDTIKNENIDFILIGCDGIW
jgi:serine/threonine protein phosphatase PrpC